MPTRKNGKVEPVRTIKVRTDEISVVKSRSSEPFIKSFVAAPENITQESLGTLVGVFSVSDRSESSGFVVNVLVSAIRKEYFANPRRGAIESFEAALHRMNLALSELVKNGQTDWIGNLHGAVAAIEKHSLHFSVTGSGRILLFRGSTLSDIGEGLSSEEASAHPLKTFVEISSGRINPDDCILLSSPELSDLFSDDELERSARRLVPERKFLRFLETAISNELRQGAVIVLSAEEETTAVPSVTAKPSRETRRHPARIRNAFSAETFKQAAEARAEIFREEEPVTPATYEPEAPSRTRFGDIYVQGEEPENREEHPTVTKFRWIAEDIASSFRGLRRRTGENLRRRKEMLVVSASGNIASFLSRVGRSLRSVMPYRSGPKRRQDETLIRKPSEAAPPQRIPDRKTGTPDTPKTGSGTMRIPEMPKFRIPEIPTGRARLFVSGLISDTVVPAGRSAARHVGTAIGAGTRGTGRIFAFLRERFIALPVRRQLIIALSAAFFLTLLGTLVWNRLMKKEVPVEPIVVTESPAPVFPPENEPLASLASPEAVTPTSEDIVSPVFLKDSLYLVTGNGIQDAASGSFFPAPQPGDGIRYAAGMDDINAIFLMTDSGRISAFTPSNRSFVENTLRLPEGFRPAGIGSFLTYLYVLEEGTGRIYRFPRAEGGFGDGTLWTKEPMSPETRMIAVSENIYGGTASGLQSFLRGKPYGQFSPEPTLSPISIAALCANEEASDRFAAVDRDARRVIMYGSDGHIIGQYFHESFGSASACSLSRDGKTIAVSLGKESSLIRLTE